MYQFLNCFLLSINDKAMKLSYLPLFTCGGESKMLAFKEKTYQILSSMKKMIAINVKFKSKLMGEIDVVTGRCIDHWNCLSQSFYWLLKDRGREVWGKMRFYCINSKPNAAGLTSRAARSTEGPHFNCMNIRTVMFGIKYSRSILKSPLLENRHKL